MLLFETFPNDVAAQNSADSVKKVLKDSIPSKTIVVADADNKEGGDRNVMLNASSASKPREIQIGLPSTAGGTDIFEDGLPVGYFSWPLMHYMHWRGGVSHDKVGLMNLSETALTSGNVGYTVDSYTRFGGEKFQGNINYTTNHFGMNKIDMNVVGPIANGWSYTGSVFQNFDPGTTDLKFMDYQDRTQIYKAGLTKRWNQGRGEISFLYKYTKSQLMSDTNGPFYYVGDGSVKEMDGFKLGTDAYLPSDGELTYMDVKTGDMVSTTYDDETSSYVNEYFILSNYAFKNGINLRANVKYNKSKSAYLTNILSGLDAVEATSGYTYTDGSAFAGNVQNRYMLYFKGKTDDLLGTVELTKKAGNHHWRLGLNEWYNNVELSTMTANFAHVAEANPRRLYYNGETAWGFNTGGEYYKGSENKLALYLSDEWNISRQLNLYYGLRLEHYHISGDAPMNATSEATNNNRSDDFSLQKTGVSLTSFKHNWINPIATVKANYSILPHFGVTGEYLFNRQRPRLENFAGSELPALAPVDVSLGILGIYFNNKWLSLVSNLTYISKSNYKARVQFTKSINGVSETQTKAVMYDIATIGWTTDMVMTPFKGFSLHLLATFQKPQYKNFTTTLKFSDQSEQTYDYSDKTVTNISQMLFEIDPSYVIRDWRFWLSFRYNGKQYANKTNSVYFNGRWETFGGVDYKVNKHLSLGASVVNILNQKGAEGSISAADLVEDASQFKNYLMSGSYIRPFTFEITAKIAF